jgi:hypothetical protein
MKCLPYPISLMLSVLALLFWPILAIIPGVIIGISGLFIYFCNFAKRKLRGFWERLLATTLFWIFVGPLIALITAAYTLFLAFYYLMVPVLTVIMLLRMLYYHCFKSKNSIKINEKL